MKKEIYDIREMTDSKEVYGTRPNPFIAGFIYSLVLLIVIGLCYCFLGKIDITARATGIVRPGDEISTVSSLVSGRVAEVNMSDGESVSKGDLLFKLDTGESEISLDSLKNAEADCQARIEAYKKFATGIETGKNPFSSQVGGSDYQYYIEFENYLLALENNRLNAEYDAMTAKENIDKLKGQIGTLESEVVGLEAYKKSIEEGEDYCENYPDYQAKYHLYVIAMENLKEAGADESAKDKQYYETLSQVCMSLEAAKEELEAARSNLKLNEMALAMGTGSDGRPMAVSMTSVEMLSGVLGKVSTLEEQLEEARTQIKQLEKQIEQASIVAGIDGIVNMMNPLVAGDVMSAGTAVATIIPHKGEQFKVQLYVSNADIGNIKEGAVVKYNLAAFPSNRYGILEGEITDISQDVITDEKGYSGYYLVEATIDNVTLADKEGNKGEITVGMELDAKIVTQRKSIIRWILEKIDLF